MTPASTPAFDAVVLSGGSGSRLRGPVKADVVVAGSTLLERARSAVSRAETTVVVGPEVAGGPVAAVAAALDELHADVVVLLACDMPLVTPGTVTRLVAGIGDADGALLTDAAGRRQYLAAAYRAGALRAAVLSLGDPADQSMRRLLRGLRLREIPAHSEEATDCDTWPDVHRAARILEGR